MQIRLNDLHIKWFKGIQEKKLHFERITNITGANRSGKTSTFDAFCWLLFGKDSFGRDSAGKSNFQIKPVYTSGANEGQEIPKLEIEVSGSITVDGVTSVFKKIQKEKWVTKMGEKVAIYDGNTVDHYWNDVPMKAGEYEKKVANIIDAESFRLITNPFYFESLAWKTKRELLLNIGGEIKDADVFNSTNQFDELMSKLTGKTFAEYQKQVAVQKKKLKDELEKIPIQIGEVNRNLPTVQNWQELRNNIAGYQARIDEIDGIFNDVVKNQGARNSGILAKNNELHALQTKLQSAENNLKDTFRNSLVKTQSELTQAKYSLSTKQAEYNRGINEHISAEKDAQRYAGERANWRNKWETENATTFVFTDVFSFDENNCFCPTCKQSLPATDIEKQKTDLKTRFDNNRLQLETEYNTGKQNSLTIYRNAGLKSKENQEQSEKRAAELKAANILLQEEINTLSTDIATREKAFTELKADAVTGQENAMATDADLLTIKSNIETCTNELKELQTAQGQNQTKDPALVSEKIELNRKISETNQLLANENVITQNRARIAELKALQENYANQVQELDGQEFMMLDFEKAKMNILEQRINGLFKFVTFKLFDRQINGGENACCITLIKGVPYNTANTEARLNAGLDIINVISQYRNAFAPVFIDCRESTTEIIPMDTQVINLKVVDNQPYTVSYE